MLKIYKRFWEVNWAEQWQYRANLLMYLLYWLVSPIVYMAVWTTIARSQGDVNGLTAADFVTYYMVLLIVDQLTSEITVHILAYKVQDGSLSGELLRPVHPILTNTLVNNLAFKALALLAFIPIWGVLYLIFRPDLSSVTALNLLLAAPVIVFGFAINFMLGAALTSLAFWTTRVYAITEFVWALRMLFSGQFVPLELMPPVIQRLAELLPFQLILYFPIQVILGRMDAAQLARNYLLDVIWLVIMVGFFLTIWRAGVRRFSAVGA